MRHLACVAVALLATVTGFAQKDSTNTGNVPDTIKVGNFIIVRQNKYNGKNSEANVRISVTNKKRKESNLSTNWFIFDLGFANYRDQTDYTTAQSTGYLRQINGSAKVDQSSTSLNSGKSSNVNIWFFMQKLNLASHVLNLKYGFGLEMYNFRFDRNISYRKDPQPYIFTDSISFSKNKLYAGYLTVPFMLNLNPTPGKRHGFNLSAGVSAGYLVGSHEKQISNERGKQKIHSDFNLNPWRLAIVGEVGLGPIRLFGSYSINKLHKEFTGMEQYPYAVGIRFSSW